MSPIVSCISPSLNKPPPEARQSPPSPKNPCPLALKFHSSPFTIHSFLVQDDQFFQKNHVENHLAGIFDDLPGFIYFVKDRDLRYVAYNQRLCEIFESSEILGKRDDDFIPPHILKHIREDDLRILETGQPVINRVELVPRGSGFVDWSTTTKSPSSIKKEPSAASSASPAPSTKAPPPSPKMRNSDPLWHSSTSATVTTSPSPNSPKMPTSPSAAFCENSKPAST